MNNTDFHVSLPIRIDWSELDYLGHVNNVSYFKYIQSARVHYFELIGLTEMYLETRVGAILLNMSCDFILPLFYPGHIIIQAGMEFIKNTSFGMKFRILNDKGELAAEAKDVLVMFDYNKNEKIPFPESLKQKIQEIEKRELR